MTRAIVMVAVVFALVLAAATSLLAAERTPPGSFLKSRATTVGELANQVTANSAVRSRYSRFFGIPAGQVSEYFSHNLKLVSLERPRKGDIWYIDTKGKIRKKTKLLPKGALVFATKEGTPILAWSCGNPLRASLPATVAKKPGIAPAAESTAVAGSTQASVAAQGAQTSDPVQVAVAPGDPGPVEPEVTQVLPAPVEAIAAAAIASAPAPTVVTTLPVTSPPPGATLGLPPVATAPSIAAGGLGMGWLGGLAGLGGLIGALSPGNPTSTPQPVPEPSSLAMLGAALTTGSIALGIRRLRGPRSL